MEFGKKTYVMGILNITPDSFSDGGQFLSTGDIKAQIDTMLHSQVDIIDVGGESTRPFADPVSLEEELKRVIPVIKRIREKTPLPISIDTTKAIVAQKALEAGASIINDISALRSDSEMLDVVKSYDGPVIIMHMQGTPQNMQLSPRYDDVITDITLFFRERIEWLTRNNIPQDRIIIDPGIGFGKSLAHNLLILKNVSTFKELGCPVLIGHSRKSFLQKYLDLDVTKRDCATSVLSALCSLHGADIIRVHDVPLSVQALRLADVFK